MCALVTVCVSLCLCVCVSVSVPVLFAAQGYDPVTGWGSMNVDVLIKLATGVPL